MQVIRRVSSIARAVVLAALVLVGRPDAAVAQETPPAASALTHQLMSPFCPELLLADCPSPDAAVLRQEIAERVRRGEAVSHIRQDLLARYGKQIEASPEATGFGLLIWWGPLAAGVVGLSIAAVVVTRAVHAASAPGNPRADPNLDARLDDELRELD